MTFMEYYHNGKFSHTIPKYHGATKQVINFLLHNTEASEKDIAIKLRIKLAEVHQILFKLEKEGRIERVTSANTINT